LIKKNGLINIVKIEDLSHIWSSSNDGKETSELEDVFSWTEKGWTKIDRVIRHKINKPMVRVVTHTGIVDVTDEHSLLDTNAVAITPKESSVGTRLMHSKMPDIENETCEFTVDEARILGFFAGDGSCGEYECPSGKKSSFAMNNSSMSCLRFYKELCERVYPKFEWVIMDTLNSSNVFKLGPRCSEYGSVVKFVRKIREMMYSDTGNKIIPIGILNASLEVRKSFWDGFYDADGFKSIDKNIEISQKSQLSCAHLTFLAYSIGFKHVVLDSREDKPNVFRLRMRDATQKLRKSTDAIKKMHAIPSTEYVYDLTTKNHHFQAGVGTMIVHNTDSVMIKMNIPDEVGENGEKIINMGSHFKMATWLAGEITKDFKAPNDLEMEKIYYPYVLYSKKRYAAVKFEDPDEKGKMDVKGLALVRRDFSPITREILKESLDTILHAKNTPTAIKETRGKIIKVLDNEYPMEKFVMSKTLKNDYKNTCQPHLHVADKIFERTGFPVPSGSRVPFVYIEDRANPDIKQSFKAEDPTFARDNGLIVDRLFYIEHQLLKPIVSLFDPLVDDPEKEIFGDEVNKPKIDQLKNIFKSDLKIVKRVKKNVANKQHEITSFFTKKPKLEA
jgi:hypothetical protein